MLLGPNGSGKTTILQATERALGGDGHTVMWQTAPTRAKIEHLVAQASDPGRELDGHNLLAACGGFEGSPPERQTCDTRKDNQPLTHLNPLGTLPRLKYYSDGRIDLTGSRRSRTRPLAPSLSPPLAAQKPRSPLGPAPPTAPANLERPGAENLVMA